MFAFFLESSFLELPIWGKKRPGQRRHFLAEVALFAGNWLGGYFIVAIDVFMQHPTGFTMASSGTLQLASFWGYVLNPWDVIHYLHTMMGAVETGSFVVAAVEAFWILCALLGARSGLEKVTWVSWSASAWLFPQR